MEPVMRKDVPDELKWDLSLIYETEEDMYADYEKAKKLADDMEAEYRGRLNSAERIAECVSDLAEMGVLQDYLMNYVQLAVEVDYYDAHNQDRSSRISNGLSGIDSQLSFIDSEILECPDKMIMEAMELRPGVKGYLKEILRNKPHRLQPETEKALATLYPAFSGPYDIYNMTKMADITFDSFEVKGKEYPLSYTLFEDNYEYEADTEVRRAAFRAFSDKIRQYENTTAAAYNAHLQAEKAMATVRGFDSVFDYLLFGQHVTREMYDRQIDLITEKLAVPFRKYAHKLKEAYGLDKITYADLKLPMDPDYCPTVTIPEAKEMLKKGLAIMGRDNVDMIEEAFDKHWIDFAQNQGKSTGGFCASPYRKGSFILLSWNGRMSDLLTLAHELGHAGNSRLADDAQSVLDVNLSEYLCEAPSTTNELLFENYLLSTNDDPRFRRWVYSAMIGNTYYHNFVTHLREAWFQREVYKIIDEGGSVTAEVLDNLFRKNLEIFWGDEVELIEGAELTWMRQPHYYMGLYPYTYSAGLTLGTEVCRRIQTEGQAAVDDWKKMLAAGSTLDPIGLAKLAGVDLTTDKALLDTIDYISYIIDQI